MSHDNKSKNYPIVLKLGTYVAFIYLQIESVAQKNRSIKKKKIFEIKNFFKKFFRIAFPQRTRVEDAFKESVKYRNNKFKKYLK